MAVGPGWPAPTQLDQLDQLEIVHGSCRRYGANTPDALPWVDDLIRDTRDDANKRPHQLVLSGDQIYADDVPDALLAITTDFANDLLGNTEFVPRLPPCRGAPRQAARRPQSCASAVFSSNLGIVTFRRPTPTTLDAIQELMAVHPESAVQTRGEVFT